MFGARIQNVPNEKPDRFTSHCAAAHQTPLMYVVRKHTTRRSGNFQNDMSTPSYDGIKIILPIMTKIHKCYYICLRRWKQIIVFIKSSSSSCVTLCVLFSVDDIFPLYCILTFLSDSSTKHPKTHCSHSFMCLMTRDNKFSMTDLYNLSIAMQWCIQCCRCELVPFSHVSSVCVCALH